MSEVSRAAELIHDALEAAEPGYHDRQTGVVDMVSVDIARALLAAGWRPPTEIRAERRPDDPDKPGGLE